ncbi:MAG: class I SAM-dependent methyltransferase, partial [Thermomicrobiales bacterium]
GLIDTTVPGGDIGIWPNDFDKRRDPSHVRSLTAREWTGLIEQSGLEIHAIERFPKRHDFADWTARAGVEPEARKALADRLVSAPPEIREALRLEQDGVTVLAFTDEKTLFYAVKTGMK